LYKRVVRIEKQKRSPTDKKLPTDTTQRLTKIKEKDFNNNLGIKLLSVGRFPSVGQFLFGLSKVSL
jgi:hypothetical protein